MVDTRVDRKTLVKEVISHGCALVRVADMSAAQPQDFDASKRLVILIHGFTSHGLYLRDMAQDLQNWGASVFLFNYDSYRGIEVASAGLKEMLLDYNRLTDGRVERFGIYLVSHSMGGLVGRNLVLDMHVGRIIRGLVMLGTPNDGAFVGMPFVNFLIDYGEHLTSAMPEARLPTCISAKQLTKSDNPMSPFISQMNNSWSRFKAPPPMLTISGGKNYLEFCKNQLKNWMINKAVQAAMGGDPNDGLVKESSVNMSHFTDHDSSIDYRHIASYSDYPYINHTNLTRNQHLWNEIKTWIADLESRGQGPISTVPDNIFP